MRTGIIVRCHLVRNSHASTDLYPPATEQLMIVGTHTKISAAASLSITSWRSETLYAESIRVELSLMKQAVGQQSQQLN